MQRVVAVGRREHRLQAVREAIELGGGECLVVAGDAADPETPRIAVTEALHRYGRIDFLINNAGQGLYKELLETTLADYERLMNSNFKSTFLFTQAVLPEFLARKSGVLVFVFSVAGLAGSAREALYSATKFAQVGFAQSLDEELRPYGIRVCTLCPGGMKTEFAVGNGRNADDVAKSWMMDAAEVADTIVFVCTRPKGVRIPQLTIRHMGKPV